MPHKPNPIPRFNAANNPPSQYNFPSQSQNVVSGAALGSRREHPTVPPRHRASSWTSQSSQSHEGAPPSATSSTGSRSGAHSGSGSGGGTRSGRSLPPPRFQRKQRPPRVQQALAAANNSQHSSHSRSGGGGRRDGANNWNNAGINVPSLSMAAINAASARGSILQLQQQLSNPPPVDPRSLEIMGYDEPGEDDYDDIALTGYEDLDPVQLHNQLSFGAPHPIDASSTSTDSLPQFPHEPTLRQVLPPQDVYVPTYHPAPSQSSRNNTRLRSFSHNVAQGPVQHHSAGPNVQHSGTPSPVAALSPYALNFGMHTPLTVDIATLEGEAQSRMRSRSLMSPVESTGMLKSSQTRTFPDVPLPQMPTALGGYDGPPTSERTRDLQLGSDRPSLDYASNTIKKPLKSALKVRATDTRDIFPGVSRSAVPPIYTTTSSHVQFPGTAILQDESTAPRSSQDSNDDPMLDPIPDSQFMLPDSLQAQYAHQLRLLQEEYASKAAKAERARQRSHSRGKPSPRSLNAVPNRPLGAASAGGYKPQAQLARDGNARGSNAGEKGLVDDGYASWDDRWAEQEVGHAAIYNHPGLQEGPENLPASFKNYIAATTMDQSGSEDGRSDIGDRGHEDMTMRVNSSTFSGPGGQDGERNQVNFEVSPVGAIAHGHGSSSSISSNALSNAGHDARPITPAQVHVEVTAPTPVIPPTDLEELGDQAVELGFGRQRQVHTSMRPTTTTSSEESVSTESNRTFTRVVSPTTVAPPVTPFDSSSTVRPDPSEGLQQQTFPSHYGSSVALPTGTDVPKQALHTGEVVPRPSLQRLAQRISRGASNPPSAHHPPSGPLPPLFTTQQQHNNFEGFADRPSKPVISPGHNSALDEDADTILQTLRNTSIHSSSPRSAAPVQASFGHSLNRINEQPNLDASSPSDSLLSHNSILNFDGGSLSSYGPRDRRSMSSMLSQSSQGPHYKPMRALVASESSSSASVESGSSHGAFTSASGHSHHLLSKRVNVPSPIAQSAANSDGHHSSQSHTSIPIFPSPVQRPLNPEDKLKHQGSSQSLGSLGSGKSVSGSARLSAGESIWALGKDESSWQQAPSSAGSHSASSKGAAPFTLGALIPSTLLSELEAPTQKEIELSFSNDISTAIPGLRDGVVSSTSRNYASSSLSHDAPAFQPSFAPQSSTAPPPNELQGRPKQVAGSQQLHVAKSMPNIDANRGISRAQATRIQQLRAEADAFGPPIPDFSRLPLQSSTTSLPLNHSPTHSNLMDRWNPPPTPFGGGTDTRAFGSVHSHFTDPGSRTNTIMLPASGGVFPRFQEISTPPFEAAGRSGTNGGKLKSLFKPRDGRVFK